MDTVLAAVRRAHPNEKISALSLPKEPDRAIQAHLQAGKQTRYGFVDPYTGAYLGDYMYDGSLIWWVYELHMNLLLQETGEKVNGIVALFAVVLFATGLYL